jgi:hypothetical protein
MQRTLFLSNMHKLSETSLYFSKRYDATSRAGLTALLNCTAALRQLAYGMATDTIDEYMKLGKSTTVECLCNTPYYGYPNLSLLTFIRGLIMH